MPDYVNAISSHDCVVQIYNEYLLIELMKEREKWGMKISENYIKCTGGEYKLLGARLYDNHREKRHTVPIVLNFT